MVVVELKGGLGNQLFEYALGRSLAQINRVPLKLDIETGFAADSFHRRTYSLGVFKTIQSFASERDRRTAWTPRRSYRTARFLQYVRQCLPRRFAERIPAYGSTVHTEKTEFAFDPEVLRPTPNHLVLRGYWQNAQYLNGLETVLRQEVVLRHPISERAGQYLEKISGVEAVALHVRRRFGHAGRLHDPGTDAFHGVLGADYYRTALREVLPKCRSPHVFVFGDDVQWAVEHVRAGCQWTVVDGNTAGEDLMLMSRCKHQIISNSSFGWWGAWLNRHPGRMVVAHRVFLAAHAKESKNIYPADWLLL